MESLGKKSFFQDYFRRKKVWLKVPDFTSDNSMAKRARFHASDFDQSSFEDERPWECGVGFPISCAEVLTVRTRLVPKARLLPDFSLQKLYQSRIFPRLSSANVILAWNKVRPFVSRPIPQTIFLVYDCKIPLRPKTLVLKIPKSS